LRTILLNARASRRHSLRYCLLRVGLALIVLLPTVVAQPAVAKSCGDVAPGAVPGSRMDPDKFTPEFFSKYRDACVVQWVGGTRGAAGREADRQKCMNLPGAKFETFIPDSGSNYNTCVFRLAESGTGRGDEDDDSLRPDNGPSQHRPSLPPPPPPPNDHGTYHLVVCNKTGQPSIWVALALYDNPNDDNVTVRGWWKVANGDCTGQFTRSLGRYASHTIYLHAYSPKFTWWNPQRGLHDFCVDPKNGFVRRNTAHYSCSSSERLRGFREFKVVAGVNTYSFYP
jgi:hypothetical protein